MAAEENIFLIYRDASVSDKIEIILRHYPDFERFIEGLQEYLALSIEVDLAVSRRQAEGEIGVSVQKGHWSDPTANTAIRKVTLIDAIRAGDISREVEDIDKPEEYLQKADTIQKMQEDYRIVSACVKVLPCDKVHTLQKYFTYKNEARMISQEEDFTGSFYTKVYRIKKQIKELAGRPMQIKYGRGSER